MTIKKAVVTGGCGFIGSHMVERLLKEGCQVVVLDNLSTGRLANLATMQGQSGLSFFQCDLSTDTSWQKHFQNATHVFHLAALADIVPSLQKPLDYFSSNVTATAHVLEACRAAGIKKIAYAASSSCYGIASIIPTPEIAPIQPEYPYALTKNLGEQLVLHWAKVFKIPAVCCRLFNVYGPRSRTSGAYGAVFGVFLAQKLAGKPLTIVGDGAQTRDFTFVTDVVEALWLSALSDLSQEVLNVGSGRTVSVNHIADLIGGARTHILKRPGEPDCTFADISKARRLLKWSPQVSIEEGVKILLQQIDYWKEAPVWDEKSIAEATREWFMYLGKESARPTS